MRENNRGITIIALVVTIIVLLILAGISIAAITGDNGIINKSDEARIETEIATYKEQLEVIKHGEYADDYTINLDDFLDKYAKAVQEDKMFREAKEVTADHENKVVIVVTKEGYRFEVTIEDTTYVGNEDGEGNTEVDISKVKITITSTPENWTRDKVKVKITSNVTRVSKEYSIDGGKSWNKYENEIEVQDNGTEIQARGVNEKNEKTEVVKKKIENIDRLAPNTFAPTIKVIKNRLEITASTIDKEATAKDGKSGIKGYKFSKDNGSNWTGLITEGKYTYENLQPGTTYPIKVKAVDNAGNEVETNTTNGTTEEEITVPDGEGRISFAKDPNEWTRGQVRVEISTREQGYGIEYSLDGSKYTSYSAPIEVSENKIIYARLTKNGKTGKSATYNVDNIDRLQPKEFAVNIQGKTTNSIVVEGNTTDAEGTQTDGSSGIRGYRFSKDNGYSWTGEQVSGTYTFSGLTSGTNYQVKVKAIDNAGNERETTAINETTNQLPNPAEKIQITKTPSSWTNGIVTVRITNMAQEYILQYSKDNRSWETYLSPITVVDNNETIYARLYEPNSQEATRSISTQITNIDRLSPIIFTPTVNAGIDTIAVTANTVDREATTIDGKSGIRGYKFSKDSGYSWTEEQVSGTYTFGRLSPGTRYQIRVKAIDNAGNEMESYEVTGTTIEIPGGNSNIYFSYSPSGWTNGNVTVTITATTSNYRLQYSKDGYSWYDYNSYQKVTMTENGPVYARLTDGVNYGTIATGNVSNIDKIAPNVNYSTNPSTGVASEVTIYINATDNLSGIGSITNTTYDNIRKINDTTYIVTANGTYYFTVTDRAGNISSKSIYISNVEEKKLRVGDYVNYIPTGAQSYYIPESYLGVAQTLYKENLEWRVLDIKDDGYVELISTTANTNINMKVARGYNNMVYVLNDVAKELYSNNSIGAIARSIKVEDVIDKINPGYDYVQKFLTYGEYLKAYTQYGSMQVPSIWKKEIGTNNSIDGVNNNGTLGRSEQNELIYEDLVTVNSYMTYTNMYFNLNADVKNNMKTVETKNSLNDSEIYYNLLVKTSGDVKAYTFATRLIFNSGGSNPSLGFGYNWGNGIYGVGMSYELINSTIKLYPMRMIVKLPKSAINIQVGTGNKGDGWGMQ
ncbi:MAG: chitobiase/beta-hexosaminidase C-terminal domain-containing protein [Clostridia bacterium]